MTDGCTLTEGLAKGTFTQCCVEHDFAYWVGGTSQQKNQADAALINCIRSKGASKFTVGTWQVMLTNFGDNFWGRQWSPPRGNTPLTPEEWAQVRAKSGVFKNQIPIVQSYNKNADCPAQLENRFRSDTGLTHPQSVSCYRLINNVPNSSDRALLIYSKECAQGYFTYEYQNTSDTAIENGQLNGYGLCADKISRKNTIAGPSKTKYLMAQPPDTSGAK